MLSVLTPEGAPVANGVMDDFFYLDINPMYFLLHPSQQFFSYVGTGFPGLKDKCVLLKDTTL